MANFFYFQHAFPCMFQSSLQFKKRANVSALNAMIKFQTSLQFKKRARRNLIYSIG